MSNKKLFMKHYKYIHLLWGHDVKFNGPLVRMIYNTPDTFNCSEHLFITPHENVAKSLHLYPNVLWENVDTESKIINKYADSCDWLLSHGLISDPYRVKRKYLKKIVWRTWGGSRQRTKWDIKRPLHSLVSSVYDFAYYLYYRYSFGCSPVIGIANTVDILDLEQWGWHKNAVLFPIGYSDSSIDEILEKIPQDKKSIDTPYCFLVGHQGNPGDNQFEIVEKLLSYGRQDIILYLPLSYGDSNYISSLKAKLFALNDKRIQILDKMMPIGDYLKLLSNIDVAFLDEQSSMALGNIAHLLYFKKKIFLNKDSIVRKAFEYEGIPYDITDNLGKITFDEIIKPVSFPEKMDSDLIFQPYSVRAGRYVKLFDYLDSLKQNG